MSGRDRERIHRTVERVARESYPRLVGYFPVRTKDFGAEELGEDTLSEALFKTPSSWPRKTAPQNPETCLLTTARHSFIDFFCHQRVVLASEPNLLLLTQTQQRPLERTFQTSDSSCSWSALTPAIDAATHTLLILQTVLGIDAIGIAALSSFHPKTWDSGGVPRLRTLPGGSGSKCMKDVNRPRGWM